MEKRSKMNGVECGGCPSVSGEARQCFVQQERRSLVESMIPALQVCLLFVVISAPVAYGSYLDAYQQLERYGFPSGILPHTVTNYELQESGKFAVYLESKCEIDIPIAYPVEYSKTITGTLSYGKLRELSGIKVKIYYFWLAITAITVTGDDLEFEVGVFSASYPIHPNFDENPFCVSAFNSEPLTLYDV